MNNKEYDIVIVGGGVVGLLFACALQQMDTTQNKLRVAVIDCNDLDKQAELAEDYDARVFALNLATQNILRHLGLWDEIEKIRVSPFHHMRVWDEGGDGLIEFDSADIAYDRLGYIVEQRALLKPALEKLKKTFDVDLCYPRTISQYTRVDENIEVELDNGDVFRTRLLVGADGANSSVRQFAGIEKTGWSYEQTAIVATVKTEKHHDYTAAQRFLSTGPLAFLPLVDGLSSIVWSADTAAAEDLLALDDQAFCEQLEQAFESHLGAVELKTPRAAFPLRLQHSKQYVQAGIALIGDAAHTVHPLAGQGVNLGIMDAAMLAQVLSKAIADKEFNPGDYALLRKYERSRKSENMIMMGVMDGFKKLFGSSWRPVQHIRSLGLQLGNRSPTFKNMVMRKALGLSGEIAELAVGSERVS